ncbi:MAG: phosphoribosylformylglycinamidine synthase I [Planctomycetes bacterium]|nr:phosphoribosylformylglycinamidine synthase I [Planctomycetota bacterium]
MTLRALVLRAAGTNTDGETVVACERAGFRTDLLHVNRLVERSDMFGSYQLLVVPGGFSYGDDLGSGRVLANELRLRLGDAIRDFIRAGRLVMGICNGFQALVKAGLLPDPLEGGRQRATLAPNESGHFEDRWVRLNAVSSRCVWVREGTVLETAVTHGEGRFVAPEMELDRLEANGQVVYRYVDPSGAEAGYPWNPNGSIRSIAGICDPTGRVLGLMPHPEKHLDFTHHPQWTRRGEREADGLAFFRSARAALT